MDKKDRKRRTGRHAGVGESHGCQVCVVFEGRDTAGKGGVIKTITERVSPRVFRVVALPAPSEREKSQMYLQSRIGDPRKGWKLTPLDLQAYSRWYDYSRARDEMFRHTDTAWAPWYVAHTDDKNRGRLNVISHLLSQIPYTAVEREPVTLPRRQKRGSYTEPALWPREIPTPY